MLTLIGLGLKDEKDLSLRGLEVAKQADKAFIELYTSKWEGLERLEKLIGKRITRLKRKDLEQDSAKLLQHAKLSHVVLFVPGDPLVATTHTALVEEARKAGVAVDIIHNASIISAIAETGLHVYRFGASATIPFPEKTKGRLPESVYDVIKLNKSAGLHTLLLLDIADGKCMDAKEGIVKLLAIEEMRKEGVFTPETEAVVFARAGAKDSRIWFGRVADLLKIDFGKPPTVLIVPGMLHFTEKEYLNAFKLPI